MVDVINLSANYKKQLFDMIRNHIRQIPPFFVPTDDEICSIINEPNFTSEKWYGNFEYFHEVFVGVKQGIVVANVQITFPKSTYPVIERHAMVNWLFGVETYQTDINDFISKIKLIVVGRGYSRIDYGTRNSFGIGWQGIPDSWPHLLQAISNDVLIENNDSKWQSYWSDGKIVEKELPVKMTYSFEYNQDNLTAHLNIYEGKSTTCEVDIWLPSPLAIGLRHKGMADIEWIKVVEKYRGRRLGQAALTIISQQMLSYGFRSFMLWTKYENMHKLAQRSGFRKGPTFYWICWEN